MMLRLFIALIIISAGCCYKIHPGPLVTATKGGVWPKPQVQLTSDYYWIIRPHDFRFMPPPNNGCPKFFQDVVKRYWHVLKNSASLERRGRLAEVGKTKSRQFWVGDDKFVGYLDKCWIELDGNCSDDDQRPTFGDDENYKIFISTVVAQECVISAPSIWGLIHGLETLTQLAYFQDDTLILNLTMITDFPRFPHRGLLLDTARHFMPVYIILETLDAMSYNKLNVFHWHITDDQSFPYQSQTYPQLSDAGSYHPFSKVYDPDDVQKIIEHARVRGIRVVLEFDTPGHTRSWGQAFPDLLTTCYNETEPTGDLGPMDPTRQETYYFIKELFTEVVGVSFDQFFHIGGDEVDFDCWKSNPNITAFMKKHKIKDYPQLESYFIQKVIDILEKLDHRALVWEEVFLNGLNVSNSTIVHVWRDDGLATLNSVTKAGKFGIFSSCWYLDHLATGGDWQQFYKCEPLNFNGTDKQRELVLGGEACMWGETVNEFNVVSRIWPRASAAAERLWSAENVTDVWEAARRLEEHTCRMNHRGIQAEPPNGPGVCL